MNTKENRIFQAVAHTLMILLSLACLIPFILLIVSSFADEQVILSSGYSFLPSKWSLSAYTYLFTQAPTIFRAYGITVFVTVIGTTVGLIITSLLAYPLSRRDFKPYKALTFVVFLTMLFNGGLVPTYLVYTQIFHIKDTLLGLLIPGLLMNGFNILLARSYFMNSIPMAIIESATIDGAGEFLTYFKIVLPLSLPIMATIGLIVGVMYWNDWYNGLIYLTKPNLFSLQNLLNRMLMDIQFLQSNSSMTGSQASDVISKIPTTTVRMAIAVIGVVPILVAYPFFQRYFVKGITLGAVKG